MPWLRPTIAVSRCWSASRRTTSISRASSSSTTPRRVAQDHRGGGVEHVRARQPVVEPAPLGPEALGDRAQEGDDVVLRLPLDLARAIRVDLADLAPDPLVVRLRHDAGVGAAPRPPGARSAATARACGARRRSRAAAAARSDRSCRAGRSAARPCRPARRGTRRPAPRARHRRGPGSGPRGARRSSRRRSPIATVATGTPGGIWTTA